MRALLALSGRRHRGRRRCAPTPGSAAAACPTCMARAKRERMRKLAPWYALALLVVLLDQLTKYWVSASFDYGEARALHRVFQSGADLQQGRGVQLSRRRRRLAARLFHRHRAGRDRRDQRAAGAPRGRETVLPRARADPGRGDRQCDRSHRARLRRRFSRFSRCRLALAGVQPGRFGDHRGRGAAGRGQLSSGRAGAPGAAR